MTRFGKVATRAALKAGKYIEKSLGKVKSVHYKGEINVVTNVDKKAEKIIVHAIKKAYPSHNFLAEENSYPRKKSDFTWVIDPLDGTTNFLHGFPVFCVSVALAFKNKVIAGAIYDPIRNELFYAEKGMGAFLNGKKISVSNVKKLKKSLLATGFAYDVRKEADNNIDNFARFLKKAQAVRRAGSAAIDLCYVACGRFDGFWERGLHPWDIAAASLMVNEAGGKITGFTGSKFSIFDKEILASNSKIHSQMTKVFPRRSRNC